MKYFTIEELTRSNTAQAHGIANVPTAEEAKHLMLLVKCVLDPLRKAWGSPIIVTSGYRCDELNTRVGGATYSYHRKGMAADIRPQNRRNGTLYTLIKQMFMSGTLALTECYIDEQKGYIHIAYDSGENNVWPFITPTRTICKR